MKPLVQLGIAIIAAAAIPLGTAIGKEIDRRRALARLDPSLFSEDDIASLILAKTVEAEDGKRLQAARIAVSRLVNGGKAAVEYANA